MYTSSTILSPLEMAPLRNFGRLDDPLMIISYDGIPEKEPSNDWPKFSTWKEPEVGVMRSYWPVFVLDENALEYTLHLESSFEMLAEAARYVRTELSCSDEPVDAADARDTLLHLEDYSRSRTISSASLSTEDEEELLTPTSSTRLNLDSTSAGGEGGRPTPPKKKGWDRLHSFGLAHLNLSCSSFRDADAVKYQLSSGQESSGECVLRAPRLGLLDLPSSPGSAEWDALTYVQMYNCRGEPMTCDQITLLNILLGHEDTGSLE